MKIDYKIEKMMDVLPKIHDLKIEDAHLVDAVDELAKLSD